MQTKSYISAAALAAAMLATPGLAHGQALGLDVDLDVLGVDADAAVEVGGDSLVDVDADVNVGSDPSPATVDVDASVGSGSGNTASDSLVDIDLGVGPNGGTLIDLGKSDKALLDADVEVLNQDTSPSSVSLLSGDVRIASLDGDDARKQALLGLIDSPNLADIDLDAVIDDRRVAIIAAADLLGPDSLADIYAAIELGGDGRTQLRDALAASVELGAILDAQGIDLDDVLAVQIAPDGATEVIVLDGVARVALLGDNGNLADAASPDLAKLDIDLLSHEELAEVDLDLLPDDLRTTAQLRLLGIDGDGSDPTPGQLADIDLDLLSNEELAELDLALLPDELATLVQLRLLGDEDDSTLANLSVDDLAALDLALLPAGDDTDTGGGGAGSGSGGDSSGSGGSGGGAGQNDGGGAGGNTGGTAGGSGTGSGGAGDDDDTGTDGGTDKDVASADIDQDTVGAIGKPRAAPAAAGFGIAALGCDIGVLAMANGLDATPRAIAGAEMLELVRIEGCQQSVVQADVAQVRAAIAANPAISEALDAAAVPVDTVVGATIQRDTLTLFIAPTMS